MTNPVRTTQNRVAKALKEGNLTAAQMELAALYEMPMTGMSRDFTRTMNLKAQVLAAVAACEPVAV